MAGNNKRRFRVALSFAGEKRDYVRAVAEYLAERLGGESRILYDKYHEHDLARFDLNEYLPPLYKHESDLVVVFLCDNYDEKLWTGLEWQEIEKFRGQDDSWRVMPHRFADNDSAKLKPIDGYTYIDQKTSPIATAKGILERLQSNDSLLMDRGRVPDENQSSGTQSDEHEPVSDEEAIGGQGQRQPSISKEAFLRAQETELAQALNQPKADSVRLAVARYFGLCADESDAHDLASHIVDVAKSRGRVVLLEDLISIAHRFVEDGCDQESLVCLDALFCRALLLTVPLSELQGFNSHPDGLMTLPVRTEAAVEVYLAGMFNKAPQFQRLVNNRGEFVGVVGKCGFRFEERDLSEKHRKLLHDGGGVPEAGWNPKIIADVVERSLKAAIDREQVKEPLDPFEREDLNRTIKTGLEITGDLYRIEVMLHDGDGQTHPIFDPAVIKELKERYNDLPIIHYGHIAGEDEAKIHSLIKSFYRLLAKCICYGE